MNLHEEKVLQIAKEFIKDKGYGDVGKIRFVPKGSKESAEPTDYWVVSMIYQLFGFDEGIYLYIEDKTENIIYLLTGHGRKYVNGFVEEDKEDEEDDDWDDI